jgi:hypothetical protein
MANGCSPLQDSSGNMQVDLPEYILYMIRNSGMIDEGILEGFETQFHSLDASGDGTLGMEDFPPGMAVKREICTFNGSTTTTMEVVDMNDLGLVFDPATGKAVDKEKYEKKVEHQRQLDQLATDAGALSTEPDPGSNASTTSLSSTSTKIENGQPKFEKQGMSKSEAAQKMSSLETRHIELQQTLYQAEKEMKQVKAWRAQLMAVLSAEDPSPSGHGQVEAEAKQVGAITEQQELQQEKALLEGKLRASAARVVV